MSYYEMIASKRQENQNPKLNFIKEFSRNRK